MRNLIIVAIASLFFATTAPPPMLAAKPKPSQEWQASGWCCQGCPYEEVRKRCRPAAASYCEAKAVSKDGKPLAGAAEAASIKKCEADAKK